MMNRSILLCLCILFYSCSISQSITSLQKKLYSHPNSRIETAEKLRDLFSDLSVDSSLNLGNYLMKEGIKRNQKSWLFFGKLIAAGAYNHLGKTQISQDYLNSCIAYYSQKGNLEKLADAQNLLGISYLYRSNYSQAANYFIQSLKTADRLGIENESYMAQLNLAEIYIRENKLDLALEEVNSFKKKITRQNKPKGLKKAYDYLTKIYQIKGDKAHMLEFSEKAFNLALKNDSKIGLANAYNNIAIAYFQLEQPELAKENFEKALQLRLALNLPEGISASYYNLGDWYFSCDNYTQAIEFYLKSLEIAEKHNLKEAASDAYGQIASVFETQKDYQNAYAFIQKQLESIQKINQANFDTDLNRIRIAYEIEQEEERFNHQNRESRIQDKLNLAHSNQEIVFLTFCILLLFTFGLLTLFYRKSMKK